MHQTFYCISRIYVSFLYSLEGISSGLVPVSATCPKSHLIVLTLQPVPGLETSLLDFSSSLYYTNKVFLIPQPDEPQSILYPMLPYPPPYLYPFLFQLLPFAFPIIMYHYTLIIFFLIHQRFWNILPSPDPPTTFFFLFPHNFMFWFLPWSLIPH